MFNERKREGRRGDTSGSELGVGCELHVPCGVSEATQVKSVSDLNEEVVAYNPFAQVGQGALGSL